jgi:hypothetical protein
VVVEKTTGVSNRVVLKIKQVVVLTEKRTKISIRNSLGNSS